MKLDRQFPVDQFEATVSQSTVPSPPFKHAAAPTESRPELEFWLCPTVTLVPCRAQDPSQFDIPILDPKSNPTITTFQHSPIPAHPRCDSHGPIRPLATRGPLPTLSQRSFVCHSATGNEHDRSLEYFFISSLQVPTLLAGPLPAHRQGPQRLRARAQLARAVGKCVTDAFARTRFPQAHSTLALGLNVLIATTDDRNKCKHSSRTLRH